MKVKLIYILLLSVWCTSCNDWLNANSSDEIPGDSQFETESGFKDALIGVYIGLASENLYAKELTWHFADILSHQYNTFFNGGGASEEYMIQEYSYKSATGSKYVENIWKSGYNVIANINNALKYIDKNKDVLHPVSYSIIKGELLGLRAFMHFDLLRLYGYGNWNNRADLDTRLTIPYVKEYSKATTPQFSYKETFKLLENDLSEALEYLKEDPITGLHNADYYTEVNGDKFYDNREMRMNYYAVRALQARVYLWEGGEDSKSKALAAAEDVIEHASYQWITDEIIHNTDPTKQDLTFSTEHLFSLNVVNFSSYMIGYFNANILTDAAKALYLTQDMAMDVYEIGIDYDDDWNEVWVGIGLPDYRYTQLLEPQGSDLDKYIPIKFRQRENYLKTYANRLPLIRISEMFYIAAECYATGNLVDLDLAMKRLNSVREHRGIVESLENLDKEGVLDEITKEYRKEFICEGQLFYYFKRLGMETLPNETKKMTDSQYMVPYPTSEVLEGNRVQ